MESKRENRTQINIILIGDPDQKAIFLKATNATMPLIVGIDLIRINGKNRSYLVWDMPNQGTASADNILKIANVIIYFDPTSDLKNKFELPRDPEKCIAVDFNKVGLKPQELIDQLEIFIEKYSNEKKMMMKKIPKRTISFFFAQNELNILPKELKDSIGNLMMTPSFDLTDPLKPIYIAIPDQLSTNPINTDPQKSIEIKPSYSTCAIF